MKVFKTAWTGAKYTWKSAGVAIVYLLLVLPVIPVAFVLVYILMSIIGIPYAMETGYEPIEFWFR
jgi:hypothetical protein